MPIPGFLGPMEPVLKTQVPQEDGWISNVKWDGVRVFTFSVGERVRLWNRHGHDRTRHYPELLKVESYCRARSVILDGEVIALGSDGKPSFHEVMRRDGLRRLDRATMMQKSVPIVYMVFDILYKDGTWLTNEPLCDRMDALESTLLSNPSVRMVTDEGDGQALFEAIKLHGMEGVVMKRSDSPYIMGQKSPLWVKIKNYRDLIAVIAGFTTDGGIPNALILGAYTNQVLMYIGRVGPGKLPKSEWAKLTQSLTNRSTLQCPFPNRPSLSSAHWVEPEFAVKVQYMEWPDGHLLRQPLLQSLVEVRPEECIIPDLKHSGK